MSRGASAVFRHIWNSVHQSYHSSSYSHTQVSLRTQRHLIIIIRSKELSSTFTLLVKCYGTTMLIPPIFPFLPTSSDFTRGELKIGHSLEINCPSSLPGVSNAPSHCYGGTVRDSFLRRGKIHPKFPNPWYLPYIFAQDPEKVSFFL